MASVVGNDVITLFRFSRGKHGELCVHTHKLCVALIHISVTSLLFFLITYILHSIKSRRSSQTYIHIGNGISYGIQNIGNIIRSTNYGTYYDIASQNH